MKGTSRRDVTVAGYDGELFLVPLDNRPVNQVHLFLTVEDSILRAVAFSGNSGVPGEDDNPLLDPDLLLDTVALNLEKFPE